uniref:Uncharacterized protein n=1 Tax=Nelumbo nucifera TaxID=4432 RepID=A0A822YDT3_NELNU|nr:TPA_asm: hypothetical protein HUJ06_009154 [Nelumbo nucifera]
MVLLEEEQLERTFFKTLFVFPDQSDSEVPGSRPPNFTSYLARKEKANAWWVVLLDLF